MFQSFIKLFPNTNLFLITYNKFKTSDSETGIKKLESCKTRILAFVYESYQIVTFLILFLLENLLVI